MQKKYTPMAMEEIKKRKHFIILGGAGKMGRGIALVLLQAFASEEDFTLTLMDVNPDVFPGVEEYLRAHMRKKNFNEGVCDRIRYVSSLDKCQKADVVFEAVIEDVDVKVKLLKNAAEILDPQCCFFSNTSSIPIHLLASLSGLEERLIGFHFYNPPPVQRLVELIVPKNTPKSLEIFVSQLVEKLQKNPVYSNDIAGFIGNGHFIREIVVAWLLVEKLSKTINPSQAIVVVNILYQEWLLRPMGIFQLIDYVGIDVCAAIMKIMRTYIPDEALHCSFLEKMLDIGVRGGQLLDGTQKPGIFEYFEGKPVGVYSLEHKRYDRYAQDLLGNTPFEGITWKLLLKDADRKEKIDRCLENLMKEKSLGGLLAVELLEKSRSIANELVETGVARSIDDVETVLKQGFYHLYFNP